MTECFENFAEDKPESHRRILGACPAGGGEQFLRRGLKILQILAVPPFVGIRSGIKFKETPISAADEADSQVLLWAILPRNQSVGHSFGKAEAVKAIVGWACLEPIFHESSLLPDLLGRTGKPFGQGFGGDQPVRLDAGQHVNVASGCAAYQTQCQQR